MSNRQIPERLAALRACMEREGIDAYLIPTDDFHASEYVGEYFKTRRFITGFTGSAGTALVLRDMAGLWTDGRYFLQAAQELEGTGVTLFRMGEKDVPELEDFLKEHLAEGGTLGYDGRCVNAKRAGQLKEKLREKKIGFRENVDLVGEIWEDRPALSAEPAWELEVKWSGCERAKKLEDLRAELKKHRVDAFVLTSLDDIAWLLNIRGNDVHCNPVVLSYFVLESDTPHLFVSEQAVGEELAGTLKKDGVRLHPYGKFYDFLGTLRADSRVLLSKEQVNSLALRALPKGVTLVDAPNPTRLPKSKKNAVEAENMRIAHVRDGVAVTKFIYWLKKHVQTEEITELSAAEKLYSLRAEQPNFLGNSFDPIIAYGPHGAKPHYFASPETNVRLEPKSLLVADTGGHYYEGSTDITRTVVLGPLTEEEKKYFTAVLRGHLALAAAVFKKGCSGASLDILARQPLWEMRTDYNHGTGHGVGYLLNVHEGPQRIHYRSPKDQAPAELEPGMITSDEPGYYVDGKFGIRHENLILCKPLPAAESDFLCFETLTMAPFDLEGVDPAQMSDRERELLNAYHKTVYEKLAGFLTEEERAWLEEATRAI